MRTLVIVVAVLLCVSVAAVADPRDLYADTWVATDALGRPLPGFREVGPPRPGRFVGVFYFICNNYSGPDAPRDVTRILAEYPGAPRFEPNVPQTASTARTTHAVNSRRSLLRSIHGVFLASSEPPYEVRLRPRSAQ